MPKFSVKVDYTSRHEFEGYVEAENKELAYDEALAMAELNGYEVDFMINDVTIDEVDE